MKSQLSGSDRYKTVFNLAPDLVYTLSKEGKITSLSSSFEKITGWKKVDWMGKSFTDIVHPQDLPLAMKLFKKTLRGQTVRNVEIRIRGSSGQFLIGEFSVAPDKIDGKIAGQIGIARDITKRKKEESLYIHYANLIQSADRAIFTRDLEGKIVSWNPACENIFGYSDAEVIGKNLMIIFPSDRKKELKLIDKRVKAGKPVEYFETMRLRKDGSQIPVGYKISPIRDREGKVLGASIFVSDIKKKREEERILTHYANTVKSADSAVMTRDLKGTILTWNKAAEKLFGYSADEVVGKNFSIIIPSQNKSELQKIDNKIKRGRLMEYYETIRVTKDGRYIPIIAKISPIIDLNGRIVGISAFDRDNSANKKQQEYERYLTNASRILSSSIDYNTTLRRLARLLVPDFADWSSIHTLNDNGKLDQVAVSHRDPKMVQRALDLQKKLAKEANTAPEEEKRLDSIRKGEVQYFRLIDDALIERMVKSKKARNAVNELGLVSAVRIPIVSGKKILGAISFVSSNRDRLFDERDLKFAQELGKLAGHAVENAKLFFEARSELAKRKKIENELRTSRDQLNIILRNIADGIVVFDSKGNTTYVNDAMALASGYKSAADMIERPLAWSRDIELLTEDGEKLPTNKLPGRRALAGEINPETVVNYKNKKTGENKWSVVKARPIFDERGRVTAVVAITNDITQRKELERRKDDFISIASHELKTPLTSIKGFVHLLKKAYQYETESDHFKYLTKVDIQLNRLTDLIQDLLDLSRIQSGKIIYRFEKFKMGEVVKEVVEDVRKISDKHRILLENGIKGAVMGDRERISQVLINLLTNAMKYSPDSDKVIVAVKEIDRKITIGVKDYGIGLERDEKDKIFDRFYRVSDTNDRTYPGLGIGLYISKEIVSRHRGKIWVESRKGQGSTFYFSLPKAA